MYKGQYLPVLKHHARKVHVQVKLHIFLNSALERGEQSVPTTLLLEKEPKVPFP
jgi:hypothetical protein